MRARRAAAFLRGLVGLATLGVILAGVPIALLRFGGSPIPSRLPSMHHVLVALLHRGNGGLFIGAVRDVSWLACLAFTVAVVAEAQAALRGRPAPRLHLAGLQGAAGRLVAIASLAFATPAVATLAAAPAMAATVRPGTPQAPEVPMHARQRPPPGRTDADTFQVIVVRHGECLWSIAEHYLGAGDLYHEIVALNIGHQMGDGRVFADPSLILPGWHLRLPAAAHVPAANGGSHGSSGHNSGGHGASGHGASRHGASRHGGSGHGASGHHGGTQTGRHGRGTHGDQGTHGDHGGTRHDGHPTGDHHFSRPHDAAGRHPAGGQPGQDGSTQPQAPGSASGAQSATGQHDIVEDVVLFGLGMLAGSAIASLERLRHRQRQYRRPGRRIAMPTEEASVRLESTLRAAAPPAPPATLRDALVSLSEGVASSGDELPPIVGLHLTTTALEVLLSAPAKSPPPVPFTIAPARQAMCWTAELGTGWDPSGAPPAPGEVGDLLPGLFTAGATDSGGYLLLDLEAMRVTCCDGPEDLTDRLLVTAATELAASRWSGWYELVLAGCGELDILGRAEQCGDLDEALDRLEARAQTVAERLRGDRQADVRSRRLADPEDEDWGLTLLVSRIPPTAEQMTRLLDIADGPGGIAALVAGDTQADDGKLAPALFELAPDPLLPGEIAATVTLAYLGPQHQITVRPQTLTIAEYEALAGIFATAAQTADASPDAPPYSDHDGPSWMRLSAAPVPPWTEEGIAPQVAGTGDAESDGIEWVEPGAAGAGRFGRDRDRRGPDDAAWDDAAWDDATWDDESEDHVGRHGRRRDAADRDDDGRPGLAWSEDPGLVDGDDRAWDRGGRGEVDDRVQGRHWADDRHWSDNRDRGDRDWSSQRELGDRADRRWADDREREDCEREDCERDDHERDDHEQGDWDADRVAVPGRHRAGVNSSDPNGAYPSGAYPSGAYPSGAYPSEGLQVRVLGPVEILGGAQPLQPKQAELVLALGLSGSAGLSNSALCGLLGADPDHPRPGDSVRQLITRTRKRLGQAGDGREYLVHLGGGIYVPHPEIRLDWVEFKALAERGRAHRNTGDLQAAMTLVRGQPFADCFHWWIDIAQIEAMRAEIVDTAEMLAQLELAAGDPQAARKAARAGLSAETAAEQLWRALMCAEHDAGNPAGVTAAWSGCLDAIAQIAPGGEPHPDTERLYRRLRAGLAAAPLAAGLR